MTQIDLANQQEENSVNQADILLVYDKQCPLCDNYCHLVRVRESAGKLVLVDAREDSAIMQEITAAGLDIDQGMVLKFQGRVYYGSEAMHVLSLLSTRSGIFNRINFWVFRSRWLSRVLYPIFRTFRNLFLKARRVSKINNLDLPANDRF
ncbi:MAG: DCC1-like thiol-disulfide oxidoreductase family protein [Gammaproteobacteria bacterium]|nr:DCC1-like thiol-disulfide oxidoreductase family protein [Gammaproteobacteria bacterium]